MKKNVICKNINQQLSKNAFTTWFLSLFLNFENFVIIVYTKTNNSFFLYLFKF